MRGPNLRKSRFGLGLLGIALIIGLIGGSNYAANAAVKTFKSCIELNKSFKFGIASSAKFVNRGAGPISKPAISSATFKKNQKLDKDKDGIICEVVRSAAFVDNSSAKAQPLETCKLNETRNATGAGAKGFPARQTVPATGKVKIAIIPVDFDNAVGNGNPKTLFSDDVEKIKKWGSFFSRGKLTYDVEFNGKTWVRAPKGAEWYTCMECYKGAKEQKQPQDVGIQELVSAADADYNFADVKIIYFILPEEAEQKFGTAVYGHQRKLMTAEGPNQCSGVWRNGRWLLQV